MGTRGDETLIRWIGNVVTFTPPTGPTLRFRMPRTVGQLTNFFMLPLDGNRFAYLEVGQNLAIGDAEVLGSPLGDYTALPPTRVLDTREPIGQATIAPIGPGEARTVQIAGTPGVPATGIAAAVVNVTAVNATAPTFLSVFAAGGTTPVVSNVNIDPTVAGTPNAVANLATVPVGADGSVVVLNGAGRVDVTLDLVGYYADVDGPPGSRYRPLLTPRRVADTRDGTGGLGAAFGADDTRRLDLSAERATYPAMTAAALQITAVGATAPSFVTVFPATTGRPNASTINLIPNRVNSNLTIVPVGPNGIVDIYNLAGTVDIAVDLVGVYEQRDQLVPDQGGRFLTARPTRFFDTRESGAGGGPPRPLGPGGGVVFTNNDIDGQGVVRILDRDEGWTFVLNLTAVLPTTPGFLAVIPDNVLAPDPPAVTTSNVNFGPGEVRSTQAYVTAQPDWTVFNSHGSTDVVIDAFGYITPTDPITVAAPWS